MKNNKGYTYDKNRKLGALIPLEAETSTNKDKEISQIMIDQIREARGESSWTGKDIKILRAAAICEVAHYYKALRVRIKNENKDKLLRKLEIDRDALILEVMKGVSVDEAFRRHCAHIDLNELRIIEPHP